MFLCLKNQDRKTEIIQPQKQTTQPAPCKSLAKWLYMRIKRCFPQSAATDKTTKAHNQQHIKICLSEKMTTPTGFLPNVKSPYPIRL